MGASTGASAAEVAGLVETVLGLAGVRHDHVRVVGTVDTRRHHPALTTLPWPLVAFSADALAAADPRPGPGRPGSHPAVAEPAALLAAGHGAVLVVAKQRTRRVTAALAVAPAP